MATFALELQSIASSALTSSYQAINADGIEEPSNSLSLVNDSSQNVTISFDGSSDNYVVPDGTIRDWKTDIRNRWKKGTVVYIKGTAGTGNIYLCGTYITNIG
jgi:hypothetical protein